ncbi:MAG: type II secretion system protein GspN [Desulfuromonadales bacterium]|nr:type II secretion system protein GspN [Desulfuromonadales bacterium]
MNRFGEILRKGWREAKNQAGIILAGIALFVLSFLLGLHLFFPMTAVQQWLVAEIDARTPFSVQIKKLSLSPAFTLSGRQATVTFDDSSMPPIVLDDLRLKPLWATLVTNNPGVAIEATLPQGRLDAALRRGGDLTMHIEELKLTDIPVSQETRALFSGTIVKGDMRRNFTPKKPTENLLVMEMDNASLTVMGQPLTLGKISAQGSGQGSSLRITTLSANGGDLVITGTGTMLLGASAAASRINLDLTLRPAPSASPHLAALLDLAGQRQSDNSYRVKLSGPLNQMTVEQTMPSQVQPHLQQSQADEDE